MKELELKEIAQIRFEFTDGTWFILDQQSMRHLKFETKQEVDFALSKTFEEIEAKRLAALETDSGNHIGVDVSDTVKSKDVGPGQRG